MSVAAAVEQLVVTAKQPGRACVVVVTHVRLVGIEADGCRWASNLRPAVRCDRWWYSSEHATLPVLRMRPD